jgi:hypothetical protein
LPGQCGDQLVDPDLGATGVMTVSLTLVEMRLHY